ncbi:MAG: phosphomannomutase/phosphoglucomutase [Calditerrivibrio sp.]|nr:phosphomannomutase/phosphoglucomutase [Calditerrivibrio sp.]MCA1980919.1 phosphomannomutase/phosphoglucomutase [Calditerrivibrio sp.]
MDRGIFRQYDIRGTVPDTFNKEIAAKIGNAIGIKAIKKFSKNHPSISVGRDVRLSSDEIFEGLIAGLTDSGCKVINLGIVPTPVTYFSSEFLKPDGFIMITGSHNPPEYNGLKFGLGNNTIHSEGIIEIYDQITNNDYFMAPVRGFIEKYNIVKDYFEFYENRFADLKSKIEKIKKIKVVIDSGNGVASKIAPIIFRSLGVDVVELFCEPDGRFPNHHPDPTVEKNLIDAKKSVIENRADFAVAFDGDADRIGVLDEKGDIIWGDILLYIYGKELKKRYEKPTIIADVKASQVLFDSLEKIGAKSIMWKTGHSLIKDKLKSTKAELAGEMSGHIFFSDGYFGYDDAIYAAVRFLEVYVNNLIDGAITNTSDLVRELPKVFNTPEIRFECPDDIKFELVEKFKNIFKNYASEGKFGIKSIIDIDGIRVNFQNGWGLLRSSNTQPVLVMRFEADSQEKMNSYCYLFEEELKKLN